MSLGEDFKVSKLDTIPSSLSLLPPCGLRGELSACCSSGYLLPCVPNVMVMDSYTPPQIQIQMNPALLVRVSVATKRNHERQLV